MNLLIHLGTDHVLLHDWVSVPHTIPYNDLERVLPVQIMAYIDKRPLSDIYVINWPWSFTVLRIWALCINLLAQQYPGCTIHTISKLAIYNYLVDVSWLPDTGVLFVWQKKNVAVAMRKDTRQRKDYSIITSTSFVSNSHSHDTIPHDDRDIRIVPIPQVLSYLWDHIYRSDHTTHHSMNSVIDDTSIVHWLSLKDRSLQVTYQDIIYTIPLQTFSRTEEPLEPYYLIEPTLS